MRHENILILASCLRDILRSITFVGQSIQLEGTFLGHRHRHFGINFDGILNELERQINNQKTTISYQLNAIDLGTTSQPASPQNILAES